MSSPLAEPVPWTDAATTVAGIPAARDTRSGLSWPDAYALASSCAGGLPPRPLSLLDAVGQALSGPLLALSDLPAADLSAMDGWAVAGTPPWRVAGDVPAHVVHGEVLRDGTCVRIATGSAVPAGTTAVVPVEYSRRAGGRVHPLPAPRTRTHIRLAGEEAHAGDALLPDGTVITPTVLGLAAAAGHDTLFVSARATVDVLVLGDELSHDGPSRAGHTRDALGPQLPGWLAALGARPAAPRHLPDGREILVAALAGSCADVIVTTGGTSVGPRDHIRTAVAELGGRPIVDGVGVKPGRPMLLAELPGGRWLVALPGNPFAACAALLTLAAPLLASLHGRPTMQVREVTLASDELSRPGDRHRLLPARLDRDGWAHVLPSCGAAMLRGLAQADGVVVVGPDGGRRGGPAGYLPLPWSGSV